MLQSDEVAREWIEELYVAERIGNTKNQRHEHDRTDQDQRWSAIKVRFRCMGKPLQEIASVL